MKKFIAEYQPWEKKVFQELAVEHQRVILNSLRYNPRSGEVLFKDDRFSLCVDVFRDDVKLWSPLNIALLDFAPPDFLQKLREKGTAKVIPLLLKEAEACRKAEANGTDPLKLALQLKQRLLKESVQNVFPFLSVYDDCDQYIDLMVWKNIFSLLDGILADPQALYIGILNNEPSNYAIELVAAAILSQPLMQSECEQRFSGIFEEINEDECIGVIQYLFLLGASELAKNLAIRHLDHYGYDDVCQFQTERISGYKQLVYLRRVAQFLLLKFVSGDLNEYQKVINKFGSMLIDYGLAYELGSETVLASLPLKFSQISTLVLQDDWELWQKLLVPPFGCRSEGDVACLKVFYSIIYQAKESEIPETCELLKHSGCVNYFASIVRIILEITDSEKTIMALSSYLLSEMNNFGLDTFDLNVIIEMIKNSISPQILLEYFWLSVVLNKATKTVPGEILALYATIEDWPGVIETATWINAKGTLTNEGKLLLAKGFLEVGEIDESISTASVILENEPENPEANLLLGIGYEKTGAIELAVDHLGRVVNIDSINPVGWISLAEIQRSQGRIDLAISVLQRGIEALPDHPELSFNLSKVLFEDGQLQAAYLAVNGNEAFLCETAERFSYYLDLLWEIQELVDLQDMAFGIGEKFIHHQNVVLHRVRLFQLKDQLLFAIAELERFLQKFQADQFLFDLYFELLINSNSILSFAVGKFTEDNIERITAVIFSAISQYPSVQNYPLYLCEIQIVLGNYKDSYGELKAMSLRSAELGILLCERVEFDIALCSRFLGETDVAMAIFESLLQKHPDDTTILMQLAETCLANGLVAQTEKYANKVIHLNSNLETAVDWYLQLLYNLKSGAEIQSVLFELSQLHSDSLPLIKALLKMNLERGETEWVQKYLMEVIQRDIGLLESDRVALIWYALESQSPEIASRLFDAGGESFVMPIPAFIHYISCLMAEQKYGLGISLIRSYKQRYQGCQLLSVLESDCHFYLGEYAVSEEILISLLNTSVKKIKTIDLAQFQDNFPYSQDEVGFHQSPSAVFLRLALVARKFGNIDALRGYTEKALGFDITHPINQYAFSVAVLLRGEEEEVRKLKQLLEHWLLNLKVDFDQADYLMSFRQNLLGEVFLQSSQPLKCAELANLRLENMKMLKLRYAAGKFKNSTMPNFPTQYLEERQSASNYSRKNGLTSVFYQFIADDFWLFRNLPLSEDLLSIWTIGETVMNENIAFPQIQEKFCDMGLRLLILNSFYHELDVVYHLPEKKYDLVSLENKIKGLITESEKGGYWPFVKLLWSWYQAVSAKTAILLSQAELHNLPADLKSFYVCCARNTNTVLSTEQLRSVLSPSSTSIMTQGALTNLQQGMALEAWDLIKQAIGLSPNDAIVRYCYAKIAMELEQKDAVIEGLYSALEIWPEETTWHRLVARNLIDNGQFNEASMHLALLEGEGLCTSEEKIDLSRAYIHQKAFNKASRIISEIPEDTAYGIRRTALLVLLAIAKGDNDTADELFLDLPCENDLTKEVFLAMAQVKLQKGEQAGALNIVQSAYHYSPTDAPTLLFLGKCLIENGHMNDAVKILSQIQQDTDTSIQVHRLELLKQISDGEYYKEEIEFAYEQHPDDPDICFFEAKTLVEAGEYKKAMDLLAIILQQEVVKAEHHAFAGWLHNELGNLDQAVNHLNLALLKERNNPETLLLLADVHLKRRETRKALDAYQKGIQECSADYRFYYEAGRLLREMKLYKDAEFMFRKATELVPEREEIRNQLGAVMALNFVHNAK